MHRINILILLLPIFGINATAQKTDAMKWLLGTWRLTTHRGVIVESWKLLNDSTLHGKSVIVKTSGDSILQESLEITLKKGQWAYISSVQGQNENKPVSFKVIFLKGEEFISENPTHDFPQRISYRRIKNNLFASIEGGNNGRFSKQNFDFIGE
jgi:hypothetical protein